MSFELINFNSQAALRQAVDEILDCNRISGEYGLALTEKQAIALNRSRNEALAAYGRVEFGGGAIDKIIYAFCDSPYMDDSNYEMNLHDLIDAFYYYKTETLELLSDDELIEMMRNAFNNECRGSVEMLEETVLEEKAREIRSGIAPIGGDASDNGDNTEGDDSDE